MSKSELKPDVDYVVERQEETAFIRPRDRRRKADADMDITPMIDVTFLLLIFFLVASRLSSEAFVELPSAKHGTAVSQDTSVIVTLTRGSGEAADIYKGDGALPDTKITASRVEDQQTELEKYLEAGLTVESKQQVLIKAEVGVRHRDVARVARAAGTATAHVMYIAVLEEQ